MDHTIKKAVYVLLVSLGLALVFNFLFFGKQLGISVVVLTSVLLTAVLALGLRQQEQLEKGWWLMVLAMFFSLMLGIRASEVLSFFNFMATFGLLMLLAHQLAGTPVFLMKLLDYIKLAILVPFRMLARALSSVSLVGQIHSRVQHRDVWIRVVKGLVLAVPVLIIFGLLFSQADLAFSQFIKGFIDISISQRTIQYLVLLVFSFAAALSFLSYIFFPKQSEHALAQEQPEAVGKEGRSIEALVFLGLIAALFLVFIGFQVTYLFGGDTNIMQAGFTYAEYARRGFWELLAVAVLSLLVLLAADKYAGNQIKSNKRFLVPALVLIAEVIVVMASAFKRLSLYVDAYSLTEQRFYATVFIIFLFVVFVLLAIKFIKSKPEQFFTFGILLSALGFLIVVNAINPDAVIVQSNIEHFNRTGKIDVVNVGYLSADAEPQKMELYNRLEGDDKKNLQGVLEVQKERLQAWSAHWQSANLSRARALKLLQEIGE
jgi:hypothetical protein